MPVFRWGHAWQAFDDLEREVDRLLQGVGLTLHRVHIGRHYPPVNLYELDDEFLLMAELPGTRPEDLELTVNAGALTMSGTRHDPQGVPEERYRRQERFRGAWQRSISLPERVQEEKLSAEFANGVLRIHLPKTPPVEPRRIPVVEVSDSRVATDGHSNLQAET